MIKNMIDAEHDSIFHVADLMVAAARTAPKGSGKDNVVSLILSGKDKDNLANAMRDLADEYNEDFILSLIHNLINCSHPWMLSLMFCKIYKFSSLFY